MTFHPFTAKNLAPWNHTARVNGWKSIEGSGPSPTISALVQDPNRPGVLHIGSTEGYWRFKSQGKSQERVSKPEFDRMLLVNLAACRTAPGRLYGVLPGGRIVLSDNWGAHWRRPAMRGMSGDDVLWWHVAVDPMDAAKLYLLGKRLWRSSDSGESWTVIQGIEQQPAYSWSRLALTRSGIKVAIIDQSVVQIAPGRDDWKVQTSRGAALSPQSIIVDPHQKSGLWRLGQGRLWHSSDGLRWEKYGPDSVSFVACDTGRVGRMAVLCEAERVALSDDGGKTWRDIEPPPGPLSLVAFAGNHLVVQANYSLFQRKL